MYAASYVTTSTYSCKGISVLVFKSAVLLILHHPFTASYNLRLFLLNTSHIFESLQNNKYDKDYCL